VSAGGEVVVGLVIAIGLIGVLVPVLPGLILVWAAIGVWALVESSATGWIVLALVSLVFVAGTVVKYVIPGRRLQRAGVPWRSTAAGGVLGLVGFFVIPVVGLVLGFVLGVFLAEWLRLGTPDDALRSTREALIAAGWSMAIELSAGLMMAVVWLVGVLV
jgi:uncharacterized protein YqgC (DUF456 family)